MKVAFFDCFSGISGDMAVGALLDAGVPLDVVREGLEKLGLGGESVRLATRSISRSQIHATKFDVLQPDGSAFVAEYEHHDEHAHDHAHSHEHHHHEHPHDTAGRSQPTMVGAEAVQETHHHHHHAHASYASIVRMIDGSALEPQVKDRARAIFREIAIAEARIHNTELADVHFHEVGALDSIVDVVAVALCLEHLGVEEIYSSVVPLGSGGMIRTQHGVMPLPAPATLEIMKGYPIQLTAVPFELTTPTGAGIIKALSKGTLSSERLHVDRVGFGAGTRDLPDRPNLLRVVIGEKLSDEEHDMVTVIESNIDDLNPQIYPHLLERLFEAGALDAYLTPVIMKKGRPGMVVSVLAPQGAVDELMKVLYYETTTLGVRYSEMMRRKLPREELVVMSEFGPVRMKRVGDGSLARIVPEYEEARRIARERSIPLRQVLRTLEEVARAVASAQE